MTRRPKRHTLTRTTSIGTTVEVVYTHEDDGLARILSYRRKHPGDERFRRREDHMVGKRCTLTQLTGKGEKCPTN